MPLLKTIEQDLVEAMKAKDVVKLSTLRMLKAAVIQVQIAKKKDNLEDAEICEVIQKQAKQRKESFDSFTKGGRADLAQKEQTELAILEKYLPKQLSDSELDQIIKSTLAKLGINSKADSGRAMKEIMPLVKGKADGKRVNEVLAKVLS